MPRARDNVLTVPSVGRRRPVSRSRSVLGSMSAAWVNCARVQPRRIRSRSTTSERTCQPRAPTNRGSRLTAEPARRWAREAGSFSVAEDARSFIPLVTVEGRADRTHRRNAVTGADPSGRWKPTHTCLVPLCVWGQARTKRADRGGSTAAWRAAVGRVARRAAGAEQGAGNGGRLHAGGRSGPRQAAPRQPSPRAVATAGGAELRSGPLRRSPSRSAVGPAHPSWLAPDLVPHSFTMWWQTVAAVETGGTADQPALASLPSAFSPCTR